MLTFTDYRISGHQNGKALVYAKCVEVPDREAYALVPAKANEPDSEIFARAAEALAGPGTQSRLGNHRFHRAA